jgi:anti-sigma factor RsiW
MEPLSWLILERYALDELSPTERARVEQRLVQSSADRACLDEILSDQSELPPLSWPETSDVRPIVSGRARRRWPYVSGMLAIAAALALAVLRPSELPAPRRQVHDGVKGGEVALVLVSEQQGEQPSHFADGERFKLLVTCPPWLGERLQVSVFQGGRRYEPLPEVGTLTCGNRVPWPGAFALDGDAPADVCVHWGEPAHRAQAAEQLEPEVVCTRLLPK